MSEKRARLEARNCTVTRNYGSKRTKSNYDSVPKRKRVVPQGSRYKTIIF